LQTPQLFENAIVCTQLGGGTLFDDAAVDHDDDAIEVDQGG
jgi:hypothetical protein